MPNSTPPFDAGTPDEIEQKLREIRELRAAITPGPWEVADYTHGDAERETWLGVIRGAFEILDERFQIGRVKYSALPRAENTANAAFIAAAPQIVDDLLALVSQLRARSSAPVGYEAGCYDDAHIIGSAASCLCGALALLKRRDGTQFVMLDRVLRDAWAARSTGEGHEGTQRVSPLSAERIAEIRKLREAITAGPWVDHETCEPPLWFDTTSVSAPSDGPLGRRVLLQFNHHYPHRDDARFIASAPRIVDELLAALGSVLSVSERKEPTP